MLYYRTHASRAGEQPAELIGWRPPSSEPMLTEQIVGGHRVIGVVPQFVFAPPASGWVSIGGGWEVAQVGATDPLWHAKIASTWAILPTPIGSTTWLLPVVLNAVGARAFKVSYGGPGFEPRLTTEQAAALAIANEIRTAHAAGTMPEYPVRAVWAATLLGLTYHLSPATFGVIGLDEDVIDATLAGAGGYRGGND